VTCLLYHYTGAFAITDDTALMVIQAAMTWDAVFIMTLWLLSGDRLKPLRTENTVKAGEK
jgi:hypothetical protein